jgi:hypothetical protein
MGLPTTNNRGSGKGSGVLHQENRVKGQSRNPVPIRARSPPCTEDGATQTDKEAAAAVPTATQAHDPRGKAQTDMEWSAEGTRKRRVQGRVHGGEGGRWGLPAPAPEEEGREAQGARQPGVPLATGLPVPGTERQARKGVSQGRTKEEGAVPTAEGMHRDLRQAASQMGNAAGLGI